MKILLLFPSVGRPREQLDAVIRSFTCAAHDQSGMVLILKDQTNGSAASLNAIPKEELAKADVIGIMADDVRCKSQYWDKIVKERLQNHPGLVYGQDMIQNERLPTHPFVSTKIISALGHFQPPGFKHYYLDNVLRDVIGHFGAVQYVPELVIEHMHYSVGKSDHDDTYKNCEQYWGHDTSAYNQWRDHEGGLRAAIERVRPCFQ